MNEFTVKAFAALEQAKSMRQRTSMTRRELLALFGGALVLDVNPDRDRLDFETAVRRYKQTVADFEPVAFSESMKDGFERVVAKLQEIIKGWDAVAASAMQATADIRAVMVNGE